MRGTPFHEKDGKAMPLEKGDDQIHEKDQDVTLRNDSKAPQELPS